MTESMSPAARATALSATFEKWRALKPAPKEAGLITRITTWLHNWWEGRQYKKEIESGLQRLQVQKIEIGTMDFASAFQLGQDLAKFPKLEDPKGEHSSNAYWRRFTEALKPIETQKGEVAKASYESLEGGKEAREVLYAAAFLTGMGEDCMHEAGIQLNGKLVQLEKEPNAAKIRECAALSAELGSFQVTLEKKDAVKVMIDNHLADLRKAQTDLANRETLARLETKVGDKASALVWLERDNGVAEGDVAKQSREKSELRKEIEGKIAKLPKVLQEHFSKELGEVRGALRGGEANALEILSRMEAALDLEGARAAVVAAAGKDEKLKASIESIEDPFKLIGALLWPATKRATGQSLKAAGRKVMNFIGRKQEETDINAREAFTIGSLATFSVSKGDIEAHKDAFTDSERAALLKAIEYRDLYKAAPAETKGRELLPALKKDIKRFRQAEQELEKAVGERDKVGYQAAKEELQELRSQVESERAKVEAAEAILVVMPDPIEKRDPLVEDWSRAALWNE